MKNDQIAEIVDINTDESGFVLSMKFREGKEIISVKYIRDVDSTIKTTVTVNANI